MVNDWFLQEKRIYFLQIRYTMQPLKILGCFSVSFNWSLRLICLSPRVASKETSIMVLNQLDSLVGEL